MCSLNSINNTKGNFIGNVIKMFAGNISSQMIIFIAAPIITRIYDPVDFGMMSLIEAAIMIGAVIANLRYERAIMLPKSDDEADNILFLCLLTNVLMSFIALLLIIFFGPLIGEMVGEPEMVKWLWFVPAGVLLFGIREPLTYWFGRRKKFGIIAWAQVSQSIWSVLTKVIAGFVFGSTSLWLIVGNLNGFLFSAVPLFIMCLKIRLKELSGKITKDKIVTVAKKYREFPIYSSWTALINAIAEDVPIFLLSYYYSVSVVGYFALANKMLRKPIVIISSSITKVLLEKIASLNANNNPLDSAFTKTTMGLGAIGILPFGIIFIWGPDIFSLIFGNEWKIAGEYARVLTPWLFISFMMNPANQVITVKQKLRFNLIFHIILAAARFIAIVIGAKMTSNVLIPLSMLSGVSTILFIFYICYAYSIVKPKTVSFE